MTDQKQLYKVEYFNCFESLTTNDARCTRELQPGLPWQKQHLRRRLFISKMD